MAVPISRRRPVPPNAEALAYRVPTSAGAVGALVDGTNGLAGWRLLRQSVATWDYQDRGPTSGSSWTVRVPFRLSLWAERLMLWVVYQHYYTGTGTNRITAALLDAPGGTQKDAVRWQHSDGTLPSRRTGAAGSRVYPALMVTTGYRERDSAGAGAPSGPGLLVVESSMLGDEVEIELTCEDARPLHVLVREAYRETR